jgi:hypothetical protein
LCVIIFVSLFFPCIFLRVHALSHLFPQHSSLFCVCFFVFDVHNQSDIPSYSSLFCTSLFCVYTPSHIHHHSAVATAVGFFLSFFFACTLSLTFLPLTPLFLRFLFFFVYALACPLAALSSPLAPLPSLPSHCSSLHCICGIVIVFVESHSVLRAA